MVFWVRVWGLGVRVWGAGVQVVSHSTLGVGAITKKKVGGTNRGSESEVLISRCRKGELSRLARIPTSGLISPLWGELPPLALGVLARGARLATKRGTPEADSSSPSIGAVSPH